MPNWYTNRDTLKAGLGLAGSATAAHVALDTVIEGVAREIDRYCGFGFYAASGARYYTPKASSCLDLDYPLLTADAIALDTDGNASYNSTLTATDYYLIPYNASAEAPPRPWWGIELAVNSTGAFPKGTQRGARVTGMWGYYNQTKALGSALTTAMTTGTTSIEVTNSSRLKPGMTLLIESEQVFVTGNGKSGSDTATTSGTVFVERAKNGTSPVAHTSGQAFSVYEYPVVDKAALFQSEMDYRAQDAPLGFTGGDAFGGQQAVSPGAGSLHPFTRRTLDQFRPAVGR